jgi:hypothetical protein
MKKVLLIASLSMCLAGGAFAQSAKGDKGIPNAPGQTSCGAEMSNLASNLNTAMLNQQSKFSKEELDAINSLANNGGQVGGGRNPDTPANCALLRKAFKDKSDFIKQRIASK